MRIIAGAWRGRILKAPPGGTTRPTGQRMRQAIFDMVMHAPWGGRDLLEGARVLDGFAGTGALGLEALSRGAGACVFMERDAAAVAVLRANISGCKAGDNAQVFVTDMCRPPAGEGQDLIFLDPPYDLGLLPASISALRATGWIVPGSVVVAESGRLEEPWQDGAMLAHKVHGAAQVNVWREV